MYQYQKTPRYFAQIADGMEELGAHELSGLGVLNIETIYRGIFFDADHSTLYRINYMARLITRVLAPLVSFKCPDTDVLYNTAMKIDWQKFFSINQTFAVFANVSDSNITHSKYASLRVKDAIVDSFRQKHGTRPSVDTQNHDVCFNLHIRNNHAVISLETTGGSLHRRGYRKETGPAPMQETVAAAIIQMSGWDGSRSLYDPMCGSGTILCEALIHYSRLPSVITRRAFSCELMPDFDHDIWNKLKYDIAGNTRDLPSGMISGSDIDPANVRIARKNLSNLPDGRNVGINAIAFADIPSLRDKVIICNPPYGIRLERDNDMAAFYKSFGDFLKQRCNGSEAYIYFGERQYIKNIGLRASWKKPLKNGGLDGRLVKFELY